MTLEEAMKLIGNIALTPWRLAVAPVQPSGNLQEVLRRFESFDLISSGSAKRLLIDALFVEIAPNHPNLKVWKEVSLNTDTTIGVADFVVAPKRAYLANPLLCVAEAKKDDFAKGRVQCIAEMAACRWSNRQRGLEVEMFGIVSNGQAWQFFKLDLSGEIFESGLYTTEFIPVLLGALDYLFGECAKNVP